MNSFKFVQKAIEYEIKRQAQILDEGGRVSSGNAALRFEQRGYLLDAEQGRGARLPVFPRAGPGAGQDRSAETIEEIRKTIPELPDAKRERFAKDYGLPEYDADMLTQSRAMARYFEEATRLSNQPKTVSNWMMGELMRLLNADGKEIDDSPIKPDRLAGLIKMIDSGVISIKIAKTVFEEMYKNGKDAETVVQEQGLVQVSDTGAIENDHRRGDQGESRTAADYKAGKDKLFGFFVGQVMKASKGKANPDVVNQLLKKKLSE